jgi:general secretion pathway protein N
MKRWVLAGIVFLLLAVLIQFPAAWIAPQIARVTNERWRVAAAEGTIWEGQATIYASHRGQWYPGRGIKWRLIWKELARGLLAAQIDFDDGGKAQLAVGFRGWSLTGLDAAMPAAQMAALLPSALSDYGWSGMLNTRAETFRCAWSRRDCTGQMELAWTDAATAQIPGPALGDYRLRMTAEGEALRFDLKTERGRLQINGSGELSGGKLRFNGEASAMGEDAARLDAVLRTIGRPGSAPGRYLIEYRETQGIG